MAGFAPVSLFGGRCAPRLDKDGLPERAEDWTLEDWRDLWNGIKRIKTKIAARHRVPPND